ncbi:MAG: PAS domain-containing methyl-accepting chemotaxis protein [Bacteriovoracaceae bacterium]|nr:PAS domain-containing methyl-accepting chemotaxis protein [Bacteriovoracaceae bacterium]
MTSVASVNPVKHDDSIEKAINANYAVIEFYPDGNIIHANELFVKAMGYSADQLNGKHHQIFCEPEYTKSLEYRQFWKDLADGKAKVGEFKRFKNSGEEVWLTASYTPIFDENNKVIKVIKFAQDNTDHILHNLDSNGKISAVDRSQAIIEFNLDGTIITANENFLKTVGYSLDDIKGVHHRIFCDPQYTKTPEYMSFWAKLGSGQYDAGEYKRLGKNGKEIWINASYNPILDNDGKAYKIVKFASDITVEKVRNADFEAKILAMDKSQAVIEFNLDGTIITANDNFLNTLGYTLNDIVGKHHRIFCDPEYANSPEYPKFWDKLNRGEFDSGEYKRIGKNKNNVYIMASYNPVRDAEGNVCKVVKYATDLTKEKEAYQNLVNTFDEASKRLMNSAVSLSAAANQLYANSEDTLQRSQSASAAVEEVSSGVMTVGSSTEEMTASIKEISGSAMEASTKSGEAKKKSESTNRLINELGNSSEQIGSVIKVISSIAQQTNLLALNATIEAARAGEAGKGFAVVANEVKELAKQTGQATEEISNQVANVQDATRNSVTAISEIGLLIDSLNEIAASTAAAVEEQSATTGEVSRIVKESSEGVESISELIRNVAESAEESSRTAKKTLDSSDELKKLSEELQMLVNNAR